MYLDLIKNVSLLVALANVYSLLARIKVDGKRGVKILMGVLFGAGAIIGMLLPFKYASGIFYDGRSIILTLAGLFGGGTTAIVSIIVAGAYRASLGGNGVWAGLATIISCAMVGLAFRRIQKNHPENFTLPGLFAIGVISHIAMLASQLLVQPWPTGVAVIKQIWLPVLLIFPATTMLIAILLKNEEHRIRTERELERSEALYHELVDTAQNLIWQCDTEGHYTYLNPAWEEVFGYKAEEMLGKKFTDFQPTEYAARDLGVFTQLLQGDTLKALETVHLSKNGKEIHLLFFATTLVDDSGNPTGARGTAYNITDRKQSEIALHMLTSRQEALLAAIPEIIMETNKDEVYTWANQSGLEFYGEDVIGKEAAFYFEGEQTTYNLVQPLFNGSNNEIYVESWQRRKDGQKRLLAWWCHALKDDNGQVTGALSSARDITNQHQDAKELIQNRHQLESIFRVAPTGIGVITDRKFQYVNNRFLEMVGYTEEEIIGKFSRVVYPSDAEFDRVGKYKYEQIKEKGTGTIETVMQKKDGKLIDVLLSSTPLDLQDLSQGVTFTALDITQRKQAEEQLLQLNTDLENRVTERTAELAAFAYSVSHDLKAPLRGIDGYSHLLLEDHSDKLDEEGRFFLHTIRQATQQMKQLIEDLLEYSRTQRRKLSIGNVNVPNLIKALIAERAAEIAAQNITIEVNVPCTDVDAEVEGLAQVLRNLLDNAIKFSRGVPAPKIEFGGRGEGKNCILWIRDNGVGFDPKYQDRIFEIFQRLHNPEEYPGTGIGLAIVRQGMKRMNGRVWAESKPGEGAVFYIEIPKAQADK